MADAARAPLIGVSAYSELARFGVWNLESVLLPRRYTDQIAAAGGVPVLLPPVPGVEHAVSRLDGLVLSGGGDIAPARYRAGPAAKVTRVNEARDSAEFAVLAAADAAHLPVLGICRGLQVINVARGGTLHEHLPDVVGHDGHAPVPGVFGEHPVRVAPGSKLAAALNRPGDGPPAVTPAHHHQAVDRLGGGLAASAWADDGTIEALEPDGDGPFLLAVQWHPEFGADPSLFRALVAAARDRG